MGAELGRVAEASLDRVREAAASETDGLVEAIARAIRKIRSADDAAGVLSQVVESAPSFCDVAILLLHSGGNVMGFRSAGEGNHPDRSELARLSFNLSSAPAIATAVESRDAVVTKAAQDNISQKLCKQFAFEPDEELRIYPVVLRSTVLAVLLVNGPSVRTTVIETLVLTAEAWIEALGSRQEQGRAR